MSTLRHKISRLFGPSEDSAADSETSNRALFGSESSTESRRSADSNSRSTMATTLDGVCTSEEPATDITPRTLKKAASTTFQAFSNSIRSKTQLFYAKAEDSPRTDLPGRSTPDKPEESSMISSPRKRLGRSPRSSLGDIFSSPKKEKSQSPNNHPTTGSPKRGRALLASFKKRAGNSPHLNKAGVFGPEESCNSPNPVVEDSAPSLDVEIPSHTLSVSQHLQRQKSRRAYSGQDHAVLETPVTSPASETQQLRLELLDILTGSDPAKVGLDYLSLRALLPDPSTEGQKKKQLKALDADNSPITESDERSNQFLPLLTPSRIALPPSPFQVRPTRTASSLPSSPEDSSPKTTEASQKSVALATSKRPSMHRGKSLLRGLNQLVDEPRSQEESSLALFADISLNESPNSDRGSSTTTPEMPSMGSKNALNKARADRQNRYSALKAHDSATASDTESDPDLELVRLPRRCVKKSSDESTVIGLDNSAQRLYQLPSPLRFAVEAIERAPGYIYDETLADSSDELDRASTTWPSDMPFMVESIERMPTAAPDAQGNSSPTKPGCLPLPCLKDTNKSPKITLGSNHENFLTHDVDTAQTAQEGVSSVQKPSLAQIAQTLRNSQRSSESTNTTETDSLLGARQDRLRTKTDRAGTPIPEEEETMTSMPTMLPSPYSSNYSDATDESCALTTHDLLCYAPPPWPTVHVRTTPSPSPEKALSPITTQRLSDEEDTRSRAVDADRQMDHYNQSQWSNLVFDSDINMKHTAKPLTPGLSSKCAQPAQAEDLKHTAEQSTPDLSSKSVHPAPVEGKELKAADEPSLGGARHPGLSAVTLPASTFLKLHPAELPLQSEVDLIPKPTSFLPRRKTKETGDHEVPSNELNRGFNAARLPAFGQTLPQATYIPPRAEKPTNTVKQIAEHKHSLTEISGNEKRPYTYSQMVKGGKDVAKVEEKSYSKILKKNGSLEENSPDVETCGNEKEVCWAENVEVTGFAEPQDPLANRVHPDTLYGTIEIGSGNDSASTISKRADIATMSRPFRTHDFKIRHYNIQEDDAITSTSDNTSEGTSSEDSYTNIQNETLFDSSTPLTMDRENIPDIFIVEPNHELDDQPPHEFTIIEEDQPSHGLRPIEEWGEEERKAVARQLMRIVYDLEEESIREEQDESAESAESDSEEKPETEEEREDMRG